MDYPVIDQDALNRMIKDDEVVALRLRHRLRSVEEAPDGAEIVYPPTYPDIGYSIDELGDGRKVALIDSVGSQANRIERLFMPGGELAELVPNYWIKIRDGRKVSIHEVAHRAADATVLATPGLLELSETAFQRLLEGDATEMCKAFPTSLLLGAWDSRGETGVKLPRLVRSQIRAWDVEPLHAAAQFRSVWAHLDEAQRQELEGEAKKRAKELSEYGLKDSPAVFRKNRIGIPKEKDGVVNPEARILGGVLVRGGIFRHVVVNLVALRGYAARDGNDGNMTEALHRYLLGLAVLAATARMDPYLREGCLLVDAERAGEWQIVSRSGEVVSTNLAGDRRELFEWTRQASEPFRTQWVEAEHREYRFDLTAAKRLLAKKVSEETE